VVAVLTNRGGPGLPVTVGVAAVRVADRKLKHDGRGQPWRLVAAGEEAHEEGKDG